MPTGDVAEVKAWLRQLRVDQGMTQKELAEAMGTAPRTVLNAESETGGLPRGLPFLRMLVTLGVVADAPASAGRSVSDRLADLEEQVRQSVALTREALELLREDPRQESATRRSRRPAKAS